MLFNWNILYFLLYIKYSGDVMKKVVKKKHVRKCAKRIMVFGIFSCLACFLILFSIINVVIDVVNKYHEADLLESQLADLVENEEDLNQEIVKLQDPEYLARYAREKYFYSKDNELIIRIPTE